MSGPATTRIDRVRYRGKETATTLIEADNLSVRTAADGTCIIELFRYGADDKAIEGFRIALCSEDRARLRGKL
jgi:hypothetical protein